PLLPVKSDFVFKLIFGDQRNVDILAAFLKSVLDIPDAEYDRLTIVDPHIKKESGDDKYGILDIKIHTVSESVIHVEIQLRVLPDMEARTIYSQSKLVTEQMSSGKNWSVIKRVITIVITDDIFVPEGDKYHHQFRYRTEDGLEFSNLVEINTLDLSKLPPNDDSTDLWHWMKFIKTDDEEVLDMLAQRTPQMRKAVGVLKELSADEVTRMLFEKQEMARMDIESRIDGERRKLEGIIADKDAEIARLRAQLEKQNGGNR
ncbi:MAG: Rpn family recombination-promoting nuclease/putative transposase, partial [Synergistaceae bacterium]|nr:Rpn family recombination-promoting nuclease/putative transposase [Synergistaceae bacterium]